MKWRKTMKTILAVMMLLVSLLEPSCALAESTTTNDTPALEVGKRVFGKYVALSESFDPSVADLYDDNAFIQNTRTYPDGRQRVMTFPAIQYKDLIRQAMPLAKLRGDTDTYREIRYTMEAGKVRITAIRFNNMKKYESPISLLIAESKPGVWRIVEEITESKP
jgi:hypothetical protein